MHGKNVRAKESSGGALAAEAPKAAEASRAAEDARAKCSSKGEQRRRTAAEAPKAAEASRAVEAPKAAKDVLGWSLLGISGCTPPPARRRGRRLPRASRPPRGRRLPRRRVGNYKTTDL